MAEPFFETAGNATTQRAAAIASQRGNDYGDTWRDCQWLALKATAEELGIRIPAACLRAVACAALVDIKYQRLQGGYGDDHLLDGINYQKVLAEEMRRLVVG